MAAIIHPRQWTVKPPPGVSLILGHPLAPDVFCNLCNENGGLALFDLVKGWKGTVTAGQWGTSARGIVRSHTATSDQVSFGSGVLLNQVGASTMVLGYRKRDGTNRVSGGIGSDSAVTRFGCHLPFSDGTVYWDHAGSSAGSSRLTCPSLTFGDDIWVFNAGARGMEIWQNGILRASQSGWTTVGGIPGSFTYGNYASTGSDLADYSFCYIYMKQLPQAACQEISRAPYQIFQQRRSVRYFLPGSAAAAGSNFFHAGMDGGIKALVGGVNG